MKPDELYRRYGDMMYRYLALRLGSPQDAEDILQETFCRLAKYSARWAFVRNPKAFVFRVMRNETNRHLAGRIRRRTGDRVRVEEAAGIASVMEGPDDGPATRLAGALKDLPDEQREVIILKVFQDFSFKEIALVCGLSINTAASRYRYAIEKLRSSLEGEN